MSRPFFPKRNRRKQRPRRNGNGSARRAEPASCIQNPVVRRRLHFLRQDLDIIPLRCDNNGTVKQNDGLWMARDIAASHQRAPRQCSGCAPPYGREPLDAVAYNNLVLAWPDVSRLAEENKTAASPQEELI